MAAAGPPALAMTVTAVMETAGPPGQTTAATPAGEPRTETIMVTAVQPAQATAAMAAGARPGRALAAAGPPARAMTATAAMAAGARPGRATAAAGPPEGAPGEIQRIHTLKTKERGVILPAPGRSPRGPSFSRRICRRETSPGRAGRTAWRTIIPSAGGSAATSSEKSGRNRSGRCTSGSGRQQLSSWSCWFL